LLTPVLFNILPHDEHFSATTTKIPSTPQAIIYLDQLSDPELDLDPVVFKVGS
jgi:hypothetical protein